MQRDGNHGTAVRAGALAALLAIGVCFARSAGDGLHAYFTQDDGSNVLNMHQCFEYSVGEMAGSVLRVFTGAFRPVGGLFYVSLYHLAGFNPLPFRAVCLALMLLNLMLAFALLRDLSGSVEAAFVGALLLAYHPALLWLFYSSGTVCEILCFLFYFLAVWCYWRWRERLSWPRLAALLAFDALALNAKEMAVTLPLALLLLEVFYFPRGRWRWRGPLSAALLTLAVMAPKLLTHNALSDDPRYAVQTLLSVQRAMRDYHEFLLYGAHLSVAGLLVLWAGMAGAALLLRSRPMGVGLAFPMVSLGPVCVIAPRGGYMLYLPLAGWGLYIGSLLVSVQERLLAVAALRPAAAAAVRVLAAAAVGGAIATVHAKEMSHFIPEIHRQQAESRRIVEQLRRSIRGCRTAPTCC